MTVINFIKDNLPVFLLVFVRASAIFTSVPIFGARNVPINIKVAFCFIASVLIFPSVAAAGTKVPTDAILFLIAVGNELFVGITIGFVAGLIFDGIILAGQFVGIQIGFGQATVFNPQAQQQLPIISEMYYLFMIFVFFLVNGHHWFILAFQKSFVTVPIGTFVFNGIIYSRILESINQIFLIALIIAAPICGVLTLLDLIMGIMARTMPQMNILVVGFSIKIFIGFITIIVSMPFLFFFLREILGQLLAQLMRLLI